ncbi:MAG TPA: hypothetical protein VMT94_03830 [Burkholderiales bacterium]|nr:hypothetical protein [Burkholderiales bacterium]
MKRCNFAVKAAVLLMMASTPVPVFAYHYDHGGRSHVRFGFYLGVPLWDPWYSYPYYPYPAVVAMPPSPPPPPSDVEPAPTPGGPTQRPYYRNYCPPLDAYYPKVRECPGGWQSK